jgi:hypothetical protein
MGEVLGLGLSHYPGFAYPDGDMAMRIKLNLTSGKVPAALKDRANWPAPMQAEWGEDEGLSFAHRHREQFVAGVRRLRAILDAFRPDALIVCGDDQYENFHEDIIPPFCCYIRERFETQPFLKARGGPPRPNIWGEPDDHVFVTPGHPDIGRYLVTGLIDDGFDMPYSYECLHKQGLGHAFINTVLYLDYDRKGWPYPMVPIHVNAYGSAVIRNRGGSRHLFSEVSEIPDPPAPSPRRCFELGQAIARVMRASPWRVAIVGSSSWSHAFLTPKNHWLYPDVPADRARFEELRAGHFTAWRDLRREDMELSGQQELLNWVPMAGAMYELGQQPAWCDFLESYVMNSSKCAAVFPPPSLRELATAPQAVAAV